eukprot:TRINITY_DN1686_c0_g1_i2.p1 TRINITY_DN1686_c0_g1~~TRINITY_DN1686_c0_g1_i2.p1  ORF type:complete len:113 (-),score=1.56 TRINITY_DN1686_c0_g1_i2:134-472(-)
MLLPAGSFAPPIRFFPPLTSQHNVEPKHAPCTISLSSVLLPLHKSNRLFRTHISGSWTPPAAPGSRHDAKRNTKGDCTTPTNSWGTPAVVALKKKAQKNMGIFQGHLRQIPR